MNSELLQTFLKIVEYRQISQAAESLYITQAAASNRLTRMESLLGVKLINRVKGNNTISLTSYGQQLVPIAQQWLQLTRQVNGLKEMADYHTIRIGSSVEVDQAILANILPPLLQDDSLLRFHLQIASDTDIYNLVDNDLVDIGVSFVESSRHKIVTHRLGEERLVLITAPKSTYPDQLEANSLSRYDEVFIPYNDSFCKWHDLCWEDKFPPLAQLASAIDVPHYLISEHSWALVPESMAQFFLAHNFAIRILKLLETPPSLPLISITKSDKASSPEVKRFVLNAQAALFKSHQDNNFG